MREVDVGRTEGVTCNKGLSAQTSWLPVHTRFLMFVCFFSLRGPWRLGHISAGISRSAKPAAPTTPRTNHHERHTEPLLCCCLGTWPLDLSQQGGFPAGHCLLLCPTERSLSQTFGKTLVYPHHAIQDLQVIHDCSCSSVVWNYPKVCIYSSFLSFFLQYSFFFTFFLWTTPPAACLLIRRKICPFGWTLCPRLSAVPSPPARWRCVSGKTPPTKCVVIVEQPILSGRQSTCC